MVGSGIHLVLFELDGPWYFDLEKRDSSRLNVPLISRVFFKLENMSHYSDAEDSVSDVTEQDGLRKRKLWDPENESLTSEIKDLLDDDVNSLVTL